MEGDQEMMPHRMGWKHFCFGGYDYKFLCTPQFPYCRKGKEGRQPPDFFARTAWLGIITSLIMGAQHALAMIGGLIVPPKLVVPVGIPDRVQYQQYLVQASLIVTGIMTFFQVLGLRIRFGRSYTFQWGAGLMSCMGVSFATVPIAQNIINTLMKEHGKTFPEAYGALLGTLTFTAMTPILLSFISIKVLRKIFPPVVSGVTIMLIGIYLVGGSGIKNWGGGAFCADNYKSPTSGLPSALCSENGNVKLPYGSGQYVGLGFLVFSTICTIEVFGSPFMRNCSAMMGLLLGYFISAVINYKGERYVTNALFELAPGITFIWTTTFPLSVYAPAILPLIIVYTITSIESVGDTAATIEASREPGFGEEYNLRIKGALFNDGISGLFSALATSLPLTTFAQNNGVIALTNVASRWAGFGCAFGLLLLGILGKVGAFITSIPACVFGGMTTFLFANVIASGVKIILSGGSQPGRLDRRTRFIMACSLGLGIGVIMVKQWGDGWLWPITPDMTPGVRGIRDAICLILSTGFCLGAVTAFILNLILPEEAEDMGLVAYESSLHQSIRSSASAHGKVEITTIIHGGPEVEMKGQVQQETEAPAVNTMEEK